MQPDDGDAVPPMLRRQSVLEHNMHTQYDLHSVKQHKQIHNSIGTSRRCTSTNEPLLACPPAVPLRTVASLAAPLRRHGHHRFQLGTVLLGHSRRLQLLQLQLLHRLQQRAPARVKQACQHAWQQRVRSSPTWLYSLHLRRTVCCTHILLPDHSLLIQLLPDAAPFSNQLLPRPPLHLPPLIHLLQQALLVPPLRLQACNLLQGGQGNRGGGGAQKLVLLSAALRSRLCKRADTMPLHPC